MSASDPSSSSGQTAPVDGELSKNPSRISQDEPAADTTATSDGTRTVKKKPDHKEPPPEKPEDVRRRSWVVLSLWAIVIFLGLPIWWRTTSIYRAKLPVGQMMEWADGKACRPVFPLRIAIDPGPSLQRQEADNLVSLVQHALDDLNDFSAHHLRLQITDRGQDQDGQNQDHDSTALLIRLTPTPSDSMIQTPTASLHPHAAILDVQYPPHSVPSATSTSSSSGLAAYVASQLRQTFTEEQNIVSHLLRTSSIPYSSSDHHHGPNKGNPPHPPETGGDDSLQKRMTRSLKYSRTYHLTFSLFTAGSTPSDWDIDAAINEYMRPVLDMLNPIHNFTIDTQVQLYASPGVQSSLLTRDDLSSFINAAEWPLSPSIGGAPTVNFIIYMGNHSIALPDTADQTNINTAQSWLIPQWGSVYLLPPSSNSPSESAHLSATTLKEPLLTFTSHLLSLLGTPQSGSLPLRLSTLARVRSADLLLRASSSLGSLARLSLALPGISIPSRVADGVATSLRHLGLACASLGEPAGLEHARISETEAEKAFFEKSMVGQLYFPDEHKIAVYLPLLGPVGVPLVMGLVNEVKAWKARRAGKVKVG